MNHFKNFQELYTFLTEKPVEPKKYVKPKDIDMSKVREMLKAKREAAEPVEKPKKTRKKKDGNVLQTD